MTFRRITRTRRLSPEEAARYREVREQVAEELPELISRHHERLLAQDQVKDLVQQLRAAREEKGLSLSDLTRMTGMDRSALSKLETGQRLNPTGGAAGHGPPQPGTGRRVLSRQLYRGPFEPDAFDEDIVWADGFFVR